MNDPVNHPSHYTAGAVEIIDIIEQIVANYPPVIGFNVGQVLKYVARAPLKGEMEQDLRKACWYLERAVSRLPTRP